MKQSKENSNFFYSEEKTANAVYSVKKDGNGKIIHKSLKYATLEKIIDYLCFEMCAETILDSNFMGLLFSTYKSFTKTETLFSMIVDRYRTVIKHQDSESDKKSQHIFSTICYWIKKFSTDVTIGNIFQKNNELFIKFYNLLDKSSKKCIDNYLVDRNEESRERRNDGKLLSLFGHETANSEIRQEQNISILDFSPELIAEQLTYRDVQLLKRLDPCDCLGSIWGKRDKNPSEFLTSVRPTIENFNLICYTVQTTILTATTTNKIKNSGEARALIIEHWITVCRYLKALKNFSALKAIVSALSSASIYSLRSSKIGVSKKLLLELDSYEHLMSDEYNNKAALEALIKEESTTRPLSINLHHRTKYLSKNSLFHGSILYLGTFLSDLIKIDIASSNYNSDGMINLEKKQKEFNVLSQIILYKASVDFYSLKLDNNFLIWLANVDILSEKECLELSRSLEFPTDDIKIKNKHKYITFARFFSTRHITNSSSSDRYYVLNSGSSPPFTELIICNNHPFLENKRDIVVKNVRSSKCLSAQICVLCEKILIPPQTIELIDGINCNRLINLSLACNGLIASHYNNIIFQLWENSLLPIISESIVLNDIKKSKDIHLLIYCIVISGEEETSEPLDISKCSPPSSYIPLLKTMFED